MSSSFKLSLITTGISLSGMLCLLLADLLAPVAFIVIVLIHLVICRYFYSRIPVSALPVILCSLGVICLELTRVYLYGRETMLPALRDLIVFFALLRLVLPKTSREIYQIIGISLAECILATIFTESPMFLVGLVLMVCLIPMALYDLDGMEFGKKKELNSPGLLHWSGVWTGIFIVCSLLFYIIPRPSSTIIKSSLFTKPRTGFSEEVNLGTSDSIARDDTVAMRIIFSGFNVPDTFYLNGARLEGISEQGFIREASPGGDIVMKHSSDYRLTIYPTGIRAKNVFYPYSLRAVSPRRVIRHGANLYWMRDPPPVYDVWVSDEPVDDPPCSTYLPQELSRAGALGRTIAGNGNAQHKVAMLVGYLKENYTYTLDLPEMPEGLSPIEGFVFETKKGHCEFYASALGVMLRGCGIPARVVSGFVVHEYNTDGDYFIVRSSDAHAWVEYWDGRWKTADATPMTSDIAEKHARFIDTLRFKWIRWVIQYSLDDQIRLATVIVSSSPDIDSEMEYILSAGIGAFLLAVCIWLVYRWVRILYLPVYAKVLRAFAKKGVKLELHSPHEEHCEQIEKVWKPVSEDFREYLGLYLAWRFGGKRIDISAHTDRLIRKIRSTPRQ